MGKNVQSTIQINAQVKATLEGMDEVVSKLKRGLSEGTTKIDLTKGVGNSLSKTISKFKEEYDKFSRLTAGGQLQFADSKEAIRSGEQLVRTFQELKRVVGNFEELSVLDAKKMFPDAFDARVTELQKKLSNFQSTLDSISIKELDISKAQAKLGDLRQEGELLRQSLADEAALQVDVDNATQQLDRAKEKVEQLRETLRSELKLKLDTADAEAATNKTALQARKAEITNARTGRGVVASDYGVGAGGKVTYKGKTKTEWAKSGASKEEIAAAQEAIRIYQQEENQLKDLETALAAVEKRAEELRRAYSAFDDTDLTKTATNLGKSASDIDQVRQALKEEADATDQVAEAQSRLTQAQKGNKTIQGNIDRNTRAIADQESAVNKLVQQYEQLKAKLDSKGLAEAFSSVGIDFSPEMLKNAESVDELKRKLQEIDNQSLTKLISNLKDIGLTSDQAEDLVGQLRGSLGSIDDTSKDIARASQEMESLKNQVLQFFSITNSIQLFKRAVTAALNTVKELDATMTEAAVVTDFSVNDMWEKLPIYSTEAQKLGVSINGMYQATTLYYQQGLKTNEAMALGVETMKMAKIAGMESAEATEAMTAALRGFNMELNEASAVKVNDVYSQLAAVTAADTEQIATAMSKTASIAASANMEFETTAALLAQIIETTQEAPETAGTALKTIIARFAEVKSLREQGLSGGKDGEGEEIDVNKIQAALRSVGISMEGFFSGSEGLDSILLKLSAKWGELDFETQRYIATMAAGSRQQSRFIAMMSDYGRTTELVTAANDSAGASQAQFNKTLESMESKLQKLENAWQEFLMGLTNNEILKGAIDALRFFIESVNKLTNALSGGNGLLKSLVSLGVVIGGLKIGKGLFNVILGGLTKDMHVQGELAGQSFSLGFGQGLNNSRTNKFIAKAKESLGTVNFDIKDSKILQQYSGQLLQTSQDLGKLSKDTKEYTKLMAEQRNLVSQLSAGYNLSGTAVQGLTETQKALLASQLANNKLELEHLSIMGPTTLAKYADALATGDQAKATDILNNAKAEEMALQNGGIIGLLTAIGLTYGQTAAKTTEEKARNRNFFAMLKEQMAQKGLNTAMLKGALIVGVYIAALAILVSGILAIIEASKTASDEGHLAAINEQIKQLQDNAEEAKEKLDSIGDAQDNLKGLQKTLHSLNKGTLEWKQQLVKTNQAVIDLITTYPELANFIGRGEDGELTISDQGWDTVNAAATSRYNLAVQSQLGLQTQKTALEQEINFEAAQSEAMQRRMDYEEFRSSEEGKGAMATTVGGVGALGGAIAGAKILGAAGTAISPLVGTIIGAVAGLIVGGLVGLGVSYLGKDEESLQREATGGLTEKQYTAFAAAAAERGIGYSDTENLKKLYEEMSATEGFRANWNDVQNSITNLGANFDKLSNQALALENAQAAYVSSFASNAVAQNDYLSNSKFAEQAAEGATDQYKNLDELIAKEAESIDKIDDADKQNYASLTGQTLDQVNSQLADKSLSEDTIKTTIATNRVSREMADSMTFTAKALNELATNTKFAEKGISSLSNSLTKDGRKITQQNLNQIMKDLNLTSPEQLAKLSRSDIDKYLSETWEIKDGTTQLGIDYKTLVDNWITSQKVLEESLSKFSKFLGTEEGIEASKFTFDDNISQEALKGLSEKMITVVANSGAHGVEEMLDSIQQMVGKLGSAEEVEQFMSALNAVDWSDKDSIETFSDTIKDLQHRFGEGGTEIEDFEKQIITLTGAIAKIDMTKVIAGLKSIEGLEKDLAERTENERVFSAEQVVEYISFDPNLKESFYQTGAESYVYMGDSLSLLQIALDANRQALIDNTDALTEKDRAEYIEKIKGQSFVLDTRTASYDKEKAQAAADAENARREAAANALDNMNEGAQFGRGNVTSDNPYAEGIGALAGLVRWGIEEIFGGGSSQGASYEKVSASDYAGQYTTTETGSTTTTDIISAISNGEVTIYDPNSQDVDTLGEGTYLNRQTAEQIAIGLGVKAGGLNGLDNEQLLKTIQDIINGTRSLEDINKVLEGITQLTNSNTDSTNIIQGFNDYFTPQDYLGLMKNQVPGASQLKHPSEAYFTDGYQSNYVQDQELSIERSKEMAASLAAQARNIGVNKATIDTFTKALEENNGILNANIAAILTNAIASKKAATSLKKTANIITGITEKYEDLQNMTDTDIQDIGTALGLEDLEVGSENFNFIKENLELINLALHGDIRSMEQLQTLLAQKANFTINATTGFVDLSEITKQGEEVEKQAIDAMNALIQAGTFKIDTVEVKQSGEYEIPEVGPDGQVTGFTKVYYEAGQTYQVITPAKAPEIAEATDNYSGEYTKETKKWENPYDKLHNSLEEVNDILRERERLERRYQQLVRRGPKSVNEVRKSQQDIVDNLKSEIDKQNFIVKKRTKQIENEIAKNPSMKKYVDVTELPNGEKSIRIDWSEINKITDPEKGEKISAFYDKIDEWLEDIYDRQSTIADKEDEIYDELQQGKEEYMSLEDQIKAAIETSAQKEIDKLSAINDSINDTNAKLLDSMQQQLDEYRQNRDNTKTEEELSDKQRRLAYLQQDTSGANALEIMQLQKGLEEEQEDYTDTLIDQKISDLQKQNDQAAEQRQEQIDIMNAWLRHYVDSGEVWQEVNRLLSSAIDTDGSVKQDSELIRLLKEANGYNALSEIGQLDWYKELLSTIAIGFNWLNGEGLMSSMWEGKEIKFTTADGKVVQGTVGADGKVTAKDGHVYSNVRWNGGNNFSTMENKQEEQTEQKEIEWVPKINDLVRVEEGAKFTNGKNINESVRKNGVISGKKGAFKILRNYGNDAFVIGRADSAGNITGVMHKSYLTKYKTGGLADFTGPAWLDGTKSKPEYILNADQTKAFFTLVDVLSSLQANTSKSSEKTGDNTYDIDINVESIGSDYDVEQLATTVKRLINEDARYRNNNAINLTR